MQRGTSGPRAAERSVTFSLLTLGCAYGLLGELLCVECAVLLIMPVALWRPTDWLVV